MRCLQPLYRSRRASTTDSMSCAYARRAPQIATAVLVGHHRAVRASALTHPSLRSCIGHCVSSHGVKDNVKHKHRPMRINKTLTHPQQATAKAYPRASTVYASAQVTVHSALRSMAHTADIGVVLQTRPRPRFMLVSDLDHTMVQNEDPTHEQLQLFNRLWNISFAQDSILVFSTGRSPALFHKLWETTPLLSPQILICSVGSEIFYLTPEGDLVQDRAWEAALDQGWERTAVEAVAAKFPQLKPQVSTEQRRHKLSYHLTRGATPAADEALIQELRTQLSAAGLNAKVVYSGGVDVDVLAAGAGKGAALAFLLQQLAARGATPPGGVQVNGDSGNDVELFTVPGVRGCIVANAHPELLSYYHTTLQQDPGATSRLHLASSQCAGGILDALVAFGSVAAGGGGSGLRALVVQLGLLQSNALAGNLGSLSAPGATWITPSGRVREISNCKAEPLDAAAAGITWVDNISVRPLTAAGAAAGGWEAAGAAGEVLLVLYELWSFKGQQRDSSSVRLCSAIVQVVEAGTATGYKLLHLHEGIMAESATVTEAILRVVDSSHKEA